MDSSNNPNTFNPSRTYQRKKPKRVFEQNPLLSATREPTPPPPSMTQPEPTTSIPHMAEHSDTPATESPTPLRVHAPTSAKIKRRSKEWRAMIKEMGKARRIAIDEEAKRRKEEEHVDSTSKDSNHSHPSASQSILQDNTQKEALFPHQNEWKKVVDEAVRMAAEQRLKSTTEQLYLNAERELRETLITAKKRRQELEAERAMLEEKKRIAEERLRKQNEEKRKDRAKKRKHISDEPQRAASEADQQQGSAIALPPAATALLSLKGKAIAGPNQPHLQRTSTPTKQKKKGDLSDEEEFNDLLSYRKEATSTKKS